MKILLLTNNYVDRSRGGVELHVYNLGKALQRKGHNVTVGRTSGGPAVNGVDGPGVWILGSARGRQKVRRRGVGSALPLARLARNFLERFAIGRSVAKELLEDPDRLQRFDVIHHHDFITSVVIAHRLRRLGVRQVWTNHLGEFLIVSRIPIIGRVLTRRLTRNFLQATGPSAELSDQTAVACQISYVPNGVDTEVFSPRSESDRAKVLHARGWENVETLIVVPRRWAPSKGVLFAAEGQRNEKWPQHSLTVYVGAGESDVPEYAQAVRAALEIATTPFDVIDSVTPEEMADILGVADVCVIPSLLEATSLSALEAMASALPIVASRVGGLPDLVKDGDTGYLVDAQSSKDLALALNKMQGLDATELATMGHRARERVEIEFSWDTIATRLARMYEESA